MLRFLTAGESHGKSLVGILEGFPKGVTIDKDFIDKELCRRQKGYGRGERMSIETDKVEILSGLRNKVTLGSPIAFLINNKDNRIFSLKNDNLDPVLVPRPGHADLSGVLKYKEYSDIRNILERASARETAVRVVVGAICKQFLSLFKVKIASYVLELGGIRSKSLDSVEQIIKLTSKTKTGCIDQKTDKVMIEKIDQAKSKGDTLGGVIEIIAQGVPAGLGSVMHWDRRIDSALFSALSSIPAVKGVEIGLGFEYASKLGSVSHDGIYYSKDRFFHKTNNSGGVEGGMTTGENLVLRIAMKPIATLMNPLPSVNIKTKKAQKAHIERSDVTAVFSCGVIAEAMISFVITKFFLEKFSSDNLSDIKKVFKVSAE